MASLRKPSSCSKCPSTSFFHHFNPERWVCVSCSHVEAERPQRNDPNRCRDCNAKRGEKPFKAKKNQCLDCYNKYMVEWRARNPEHWKVWKKNNNGRLHATVKRTISKSPRSFITYLMGRLKKPSNAWKTRSGRPIPARRLAILNDVQIDLDYVVALWDAQGGRCALTGLPMTHQFRDLNAASIDRKDSQKGYIPGNVQLVCQWVNKAKGNHDDIAFKNLLIQLGAEQRLRIYEDADPKPGDPVDALMRGIVQHFREKWWLLDGEIKIYPSFDGEKVFSNYLSLDFAGWGVIVQATADGMISAEEMLVSEWQGPGKDPLRFMCDLADPGCVEKLLAVLDRTVEARK